MLQTDGYDGSTTYEYDDQGRLKRASEPSGTTIWNYYPGQITAVLSDGEVIILALDANGRVLHIEEPSASDDRPTSDYGYDANGHIISLSGHDGSSTTPGGPTVYSFQYTYDDLGRIASASKNSQPPTTFTYTETPGHLTIGLSGAQPGEYAYDFDSEGRVVRAAANGFDQTFTIAGDTITMVTNVGYEVDATGACAGPVATFGPTDPLPIRIEGDVVTFLNPPVMDFLQQYD